VFSVTFSCPGVRGGCRLISIYAQHAECFTAKRTKLNSGVESSRGDGSIGVLCVFFCEILSGSWITQASYVQAVGGTRAFL
jgi:hypothetical protein